MALCVLNFRLLDGGHKNKGFLIYLLSSALKMEQARPSETIVSTDKTASQLRAQYPEFFTFSDKISSS
jgi:hypothetical protein